MISVIRQRAVKVLSPYSGEVDSLDWTNPTEITIYNCALAPSNERELTGLDRNTAVKRYTLYVTRSEADIAVDDRVVYRGGLYLVVQEPEVWVSPFTGVIGGTTVILEMLR